MVKNSYAIPETRLDPWIGKIPWRRNWQPTPVFLPGESHEQRSLVELTVDGVTKCQVQLNMTAHTDTCIPLLLYNFDIYSSYLFLYFFNREICTFIDLLQTRKQENIYKNSRVMKVLLNFKTDYYFLLWCLWGEAQIEHTCRIISSSSFFTFFFFKVDH